MSRRKEERFDVKDWRDIDTLYPNQWVAFEVEEVTPGVGITKGRIIARGKSERKVLDKLDAFSRAHPGKHTALFDTRPWRLKPGEDAIINVF
jgi:hypothetical protein